MWFLEMEKDLDMDKLIKLNENRLESKPGVIITNKPGLNYNKCSIKGFGSLHHSTPC